MSADTMPDPVSAYQLRRHLAHDHGEDLQGAGWFELDQAHRHFHRVGADHEHEKLAG
jgi:hypothetical protein